MLTQRMQIQAIADCLAGLPVQARSSDFQQPWLACWQGIEQAEPGEEHNALHRVLSAMPEGQQLIQTILSTRPGYRPTIPSLADIAPGLSPIEWVWDGWIPRGFLTVMGASQGSGKSFVATDLAYRVIHNKGYPDGSAVQKPGSNVIYVDGEMVPQLLNERAEQYGMDKGKLFMLLADPGEMLDLGDSRYQDRLTEMTEILKPELIVIDSLSSIHSSGQNGVEDVRALIGYMTRLVSAANCALVLIHHIRKTNNGQRMLSADFGMEDLSGSGYITQAARVVLGLRIVQTGPDFDPNGPREFKMLKNNLGTVPAPLGFSFAPLHPKGVMLKWQQAAPQVYREPSKLDDCKDWLEDLLRVRPDGMRPKEVEELGIEFGFKRDMVHKARKELRRHIDNSAGRQAPNNRWVWSEKFLLDIEEED
jgi:KaiC/GvpD/RAD55 family RecA-like ATPase